MKRWQAVAVLRRVLAGLCLVAVWLGVSSQPSWGNPTSAPPAPFAPGRILVKFKPGALANSVGQNLPGISVQAVPAPELAKLGANVLHVPDNQLTTTLAALQHNPLVAYAEPDYQVQAADVVTPNDPYWGSQWGPPDIQAPQAWAVTTGTASVTIAVIDTGVDLTHPDLAAQIDLVNSKSFLAYAPTAQDDYGHGTHVAGIAAAIGNNLTGIAGMAWGVRIMALKVLDYSGSGYESDVAAAITYAADHGAQVINISLGGTGASQTLADAVNYAYTHGVTIVAAAGNNDSSSPFYPAAYPHVIAVASVDSNNQRSYFSNYGSDIAVAAPGGSIFSTYPVSMGSYTTMSGTSMATPHVAGVAALLASLPLFNTPDKIRAALENTAKDLTVDSSGVCQSGPNWDPCYGYGLVQAYDALQYRYHVQANPATTFQFGSPAGVVTYTLTVSNTGVLTDSFTVTVNSGSPFTNTVAPASISNLAPFANAPVTLTVAIPQGAASGTQDPALITVTSSGNGAQWATATITTTVPYTTILPLVFR
jgi:thermitase